MSVSDRSQQVDRCFRLLADRRRRFCLYHLILANEPLSLRDLAGAVEASLAPPGVSVTERMLEEAVRQIAHTHLPKLHDAGLVRGNDGYVHLTPDPTHPIQEWLASTAAFELDLARKRDRWSARHSTGDRPDDRPTASTRGNEDRSHRVGRTR